MASIILRQFGGMQPSANKKAIPEAAATYVRNLDLRFGDFRPLPVAASEATGLTAGETLYKFDGASTFITKTGDVSYVRGPIPNDTTERTYYTGDGVPKVTDLSNDTRQLGVPAPTAAPSVVVNTIDELTGEEAQTKQGESLTDLINIVRANATWTYTGLNDGELTPDFVATSRPWEFVFVVAGTLVSGSFVPTNAAHRNLLDARLGFYLETDGGTTTAKIPLFLRGGVLSFDASLSTDLQALTSPEDGSQLLTADQISAISQALTDHLAAASQSSSDAIDRLRQLKVEFTTLASSTEILTEADADAVKTFYARTEVDTAIDNAKTQAAREIINSLTSYNTTPP